MPGFLQPNPLGLVEQRFSQQVIGMLGTHCDQDFLLQRKYTAFGQQAQANLLDQIGHIVDFKIRRPVRQVRARQAVHAALPEGLGREQLRVIGPIHKRVRISTPTVRLGQGPLVHQRAQHPVGPIGRQACGLGALTALLALPDLGGPSVQGDKYAAAWSCIQKAVVHQLDVGRRDRVATQAQHFGQLA